MASDLDDILSVPIPCPVCGKETVAKLGFLNANNTIPCRSCGAVIDLTDPERRAFIDQFSEAAASVIPPIEDVLKKRS